MNAPACRFVVLHHTGIDPPHYDLMYEREPGGMLATWRLPAWPPPGSIPVEPLGDHRRAYLDYEGPVSGDRGNVRRVASGTCRVAREHAAIDLELETPAGPMRIILERGNDGRWTARSPA